MKTRHVCAVIGVAAAVGAVAFMQSLVATNDAQAVRVAERLLAEMPVEEGAMVCSMQLDFRPDGRVMQGPPMMACIAAEKGRVALGDGECIVSADLDMMKMVISNFMSNAIKYGKTKVEVLLVNGSNNVTFKITNDGEPISRKDQKKIWDLFYKKDKSGSDRLSSTGVGLAVNKSILDIHKAKFGVESSAAGTTFWFEMKKAKE